MWDKSHVEDKLDCHFLPSTLFELGSLLFPFCSVHQANWSSSLQGILRSLPPFLLSGFADTIQCIWHFSWFRELNSGCQDCVVSAFTCKILSLFTHELFKMSVVDRKYNEEFFFLKIQEGTVFCMFFIHRVDDGTQNIICLESLIKLFQNYPQSCTLWSSQMYLARVSSILLLAGSLALYELYKLLLGRRLDDVWYYINNFVIRLDVVSSCNFTSVWSMDENWLMIPHPLLCWPAFLS